MEIAKAESEAFEAQLALETNDFEKADHRAYRAMVLAARALVRTQFLDVGDAPERIVEEFRTRFYETKLFFDKYAKGKFAQYLFNRHHHPNPSPGRDEAHRLIEEAQLFIEAAHACDMRTNETAEPIAAKPSADKKPKLPPSVKLPPKGQLRPRGKLPPGFEARRT